MAPLKATIAAAAACLALAGAQSLTLPPVVDCGSVTQPNDISSRYPMNATGVLNGTLVILPVSLDFARSIIPAKYGILENVYRELMPNFPDGQYPILLQAMHDHDIKFGSLGLSDFQRTAIEFPFVDLLGDGSTAFRWSSAMFITGTNAIGIGAIQDYGVIAVPSFFSPACNAYAETEPGVYSYSASEGNTTSSCMDNMPCVSTTFKKDIAPLDREMMAYFVNATNQPSFGNGTGCNNQIRMFDEGSVPGSNPWAPVPVVGDVYTLGAIGMTPGHAGDVLEFDSVQGVHAASRFIENNDIPCEQFRGYGEHSIQELLAWVPSPSYTSGMQTALNPESAAGLEDGSSPNGSGATPGYFPSPVSLAAMVKRYMVKPLQFVTG